MTDPTHEAEVQRQLALDERARHIIARFRARPRFLERMRDAYEAKLRKDYVRQDDLQRPKDA